MEQPLHPAILATINITHMLSESGIQKLIAVLENATLPLTAGPLQVQSLLHCSASETRAIVGLLHQWQAWGKEASTLAITLLATHATRKRVQAESPSVSLIWTGPSELPHHTRTTENALVDLIAHAQQEIIIVGYTLTLAVKHIILYLAQAQQRGVQVVLFVDRMEENQLLPILKSCWPPHQMLPFLYTRQASTSDPKSALHAKAMIIDNRAMLATSANLSYHGLAGNIELGLLVEGHVAQEAANLLKTLIIEGVCTKVDTSEAF
jgi:phosphatidylserine/phosphatidylglycerophosphate/cardiolipin synthase-like enzyme